MFRRQGMEAAMGIGGGIVSPESQKNLEIAEDLMRRNEREKATPYLRKSMEDPNNIDAILRYSTLCKDPKEALVYLKQAESRGRAMLQNLLGDNCFEDGATVGKFWSILQTRPYMRVLHGLYEAYLDYGNFEEACNVMIEMLRLCPADNQGTRLILGSVLIHCGRYADALYFAQQWLGTGTLDDESPRDGAVVFQKPHRNTMAVKKEKNHRSSYGSLLYTAALASFKHFGDCEQSRQYLKLAAIAQPSVLVKILAKVKHPTNWSASGLTTFNGPEEAHDYLVISHDLWMEPDVWKWANENPDVKNAILKTCSRPECNAREIRAAEYKRCSGCHLVSYCTPECQKDDWERHKSACRQHKKQKVANRAFMAMRRILNNIWEFYYYQEISINYCVLNLSNMLVSSANISKTGHPTNTLSDVIGMVMSLSMVEYPFIPPLINSLRIIFKLANWRSSAWITPNEPEEVNNYLVISHDWMEPNVWKWANKNPDIKSIDP